MHKQKRQRVTGGFGSSAFWGAVLVDYLFRPAFGVFISGSTKLLTS